MSERNSSEEAAHEVFESRFSTKPTRMGELYTNDYWNEKWHEFKIIWNACGAHYQREIEFWASHTPTDVFVEDYTKMQNKLLHATRSEQVWRAEWEQISEIAKEQQELIQHNEEAVQAARQVGNFFGMRYMMAWHYGSLPNQVADKIKELEGKE